MDNLTPITREEILMNDEPLTPITREEKILAGEDLTPVTRREYFLKKYRHAGSEVMVEGLSVTANGTYTAPEGKAYSPVEVNVPLPENAYLLKEASGSLVSFSDGADLPMPSFICNIDAVQDLHGYDRPWPPGGGKNLLETTATSQTKNGVTYTVNDDGTVTVNGTATDLSVLTVGEVSLIGGTSYVLSSSSPNNGGFYLQAIGSGISGVNTISGAITFTPPADMTSKIRIAVAINNTINNVVVKPMLCLASAQNPTVFVPYKYENICPISGHTGVDAVISPTTEASAGTTYSISWQTEAGEVFDGYVDLVSGVLTVTHKSQTGFTRGSQDSSNKLYNIGTIADIKAFTDARNISPYFIDSMFEKLSVGEARAAETPSITHHDHTFYVGGYIGKEAELDTLLETLQVKYELETPITYQLTPTQIKSLLGYNNAWCSTGDVNIDYFAKEV